MSHAIKIWISNWPHYCRSCFWLFSTRSRVGHGLRPIFVLWLVIIWQASSSGKFMQHLEICLLWTEGDRVLCHLAVFINCLFPQDVQNEIQLLSRLSSYSWLVCSLSLIFGWEMRGNPISDVIVFVFHLAWCVRGLKSLKRFRPNLKAFRNCISTGKPE